MDDPEKTIMRIRYADDIDGHPNRAETTKFKGEKLARFLVNKIRVYEIC